MFLDANVLFSASNTESNIARLITWLLAQGTAVTCDFALEEARRNIVAKRPAWSVGFTALVARLEVVPAARFELPVEVAEKDAPILCAAIQASCNVLVTGDRRHFGHLYGQTIAGVAVMSIHQLATALRDASGG